MDFHLSIQDKIIMFIIIVENIENLIFAEVGPIRSISAEDSHSL